MQLFVSFRPEREPSIRFMAIWARLFTPMCKKKHELVMNNAENLGSVDPLPWSLFQTHALVLVLYHVIPDDAKRNVCIAVDRIH